MRGIAGADAEAPRFRLLTDRPKRPVFQVEARRRAHRRCGADFAQRGHGKLSSFYADTLSALGATRRAGPGRNAYSGSPTPELSARLWVRDNTVERYLPVR